MALVSVIVAIKEVVFAIFYFIAPITERIFTKMIDKSNIIQIATIVSYSSMYY